MDRSQVPKYVMSTLCRICAEKSSKLTPIFDTDSLAIKIYRCLPIKVTESDNLPLKICESCFVKINASYTLYLKADEADQRLRKLWKILLKETTSDNFEDKTVAVINDCEPFSRVQDETPSNLDSSSLVINIPEEITYHNLELLESSTHFSRFPNEIMVISKAIPFENVDDCLVLDSLEKNDKQLKMEENQRKDLTVNEIKIPKPKEQTLLSQPFQPPPFQTLDVQESNTSDDKPFLCDTCGKSFKHGKYLRLHARTHLTVRKKYSCKICNKEFLTNFFLQEHMNFHTGETPYKCLVCSKEFREKVHLRQHKWTHLNQKFVCSICGSKFNRKGNLSEHLKQHRKNGDAVKTKSKEPRKENQDGFKCPACDMKFTNQAVLKNHMKTHPEQKKFSCLICNKKFRHPGSLTYHRRTAHTGERPFQCSFCDERFSLRSVKTNHERKAHTFEHPYKCTLCTKSFTNSSSLKNHTFVHTKEKMFKCEECGKGFTRVSNLHVHKKLHSGDRKFTCDQCDKTYIQKHDLVKHMKVHDPKSKPFFCKYCGNSFSHKKDSTKHSMCQFDFMRKNNSEFYSAEKILDSVANSLEKNDREFSVEEEQQIILDSVEESVFSVEKTGIIYEVTEDLTSE